MMKKMNKKTTSSQSLMPLEKNLNKLLKDIPSSEYHGLVGTWSSTQFKDILDDEEVFIRKYIKKEIARVEKEAFDTGTYLHTGILEPHKIEEEIAMYPGKVRFGKAFDKFKALNAGKAIITPSQKENADKMMEAIRSSKTAMKYLKGEPEVSLFVRLVIFEGKVYAPDFGKVLDSDGWLKANTPKNLDEGGYEIIVKVRADNLGDHFVSDLKSTSGNARSESGVRSTISKYKYDLSASLYVDMFSLVRPEIRDFIWIFSSKTLFNSGTWGATDIQIRVGRAKYYRAMVKLADCATNNWQTLDCLRYVDPLPHELEILREKDTDFL